jgi:hypothetical protein
VHCYSTPDKHSVRGVKGVAEVQLDHSVALRLEFPTHCPYCRCRGIFDGYPNLPPAQEEIRRLFFDRSAQRFAGGAPEHLTDANGADSASFFAQGKQLSPAPKLAVVLGQPAPSHPAEEFCDGEDGSRPHCLRRVHQRAEYVFRTESGRAWS